MRIGIWRGKVLQKPCPPGQNLEGGQNKEASKSVGIEEALETLDLDTDHLEEVREALSAEDDVLDEEMIVPFQWILIGGRRDHLERGHDFLMQII